MGNDQLKILIVDDERSNLEVLSHILKPGDADPIHSNYMLTVTKSGQSALTKVLNDKPDLILLDIIMPDMSGFDVLTVLQCSDITRSIPVIIITGLSSIEEEEKGFAMGAVDYITKPFHSSIVRARVRTHLRIVEQMRTIERIGLIDVLTNITNRRGFDNQITMEWSRAIREKTPVSFLMIDIDKFKELNDTYGHQQGDVILKRIAQILTSTLKRSADFAARWGGEEFAVLLPDTALDGALEVAESIRKNIEAATFPSIRGFSGLKVTVSIGVASESPVFDSVMSDFIGRADKALYASKESGRNKVSYDN